MTETLNWRPLARGAWLAGAWAGSLALVAGVASTTPRDPSCADRMAACPGDVRLAAGLLTAEAVVLALVLRPWAAGPAAGARRRARAALAVAGGLLLPADACFMHAGPVLTTGLLRGMLVLAAAVLAAWWWTGRPGRTAA